MVKLRRLYGQIAVSRSDPLQGSDKNRAGRWNISVGQLVWRGLIICRVVGNTEVELKLYKLRPKWSKIRRRLYANHSGGYMPRTTTMPFLGRTLCRGPTKTLIASLFWPNLNNKTKLNAARLSATSTKTTEKLQYLQSTGTYRSSVAKRKDKTTYPDSDWSHVW